MSRLEILKIGVLGANFGLYSLFGERVIESLRSGSRIRDSRSKVRPPSEHDISVLRDGIIEALKGNAVRDYFSSKAMV
jgi:hypothetical protein